MDDVMVFSTHKQHFEDLANLLTADNISFKISPFKHKFFSEISLFVLKDGKQVYRPMREKFDAVIKIKRPNP